MSISSVSSRITNNPVLRDRLRRAAVPLTVGGIVGTHTFMDIKKASGEDKKNVGINNLLITAAMIAGGYLANAGSKRFIQKNEEKLAKYTREFLEAVCIPAGAGIAGGIGGEVAQRIFPVKNETPYEKLHKKGFVSEIDYGVISKAYGVDTVQIARSVDDGFSTIVGFSVGREKGIKNKVKKFVFEMVSTVLVPFSVILPLNGLLKKKLPDRKNVRNALLLGIGITSSVLGRTAARWFDKKVTNRVVENRIWTDLSRKQQELMKKLVLTHTPDKKQDITKEIQKIDKMKKEITQKPSKTMV